MRLKLFVIVLGMIFLLLDGFRPDALPYTPGGAYSDAATSHLPAAQFLRRSVVDDGEFPLWRETILAGQPFAADPLNKTAYPLQWLVLILPPVLHLDLMIVLHLLIAGAGMWVWARALGLRDEAAALSALAYALAPRVIGHTGAGHLDLLYALAWFPWLLWAAEKLVTFVPHVGARYTSPLRAQLWAGLFGALMLLADVRLSLFAYALAGAYAVYEAVRAKHLRRLWRFVPAGALVVLLTLSFSLPLLAWRPYLSRGALTPGEAGVFSLNPAQLVGLILPPQSGNVETLTYLGVPVLALAVIGAVTARRWFWGAAAGIAALYALGVNGFLWSALVRIIPAMLWFRVPSRAWMVVALIAPLLAGYGVEWLLERRRFGTLLPLIITAASAAGGVFFLLSVPAISGLALLVGGVGFGLIILASNRRSTLRPYVGLALIVVVFLDLAIAGRGWLEWRTQDTWLRPDQVHLAERLVELGAYRVYSPTYSLQQQVAEDYHLRLFGGVDPFQLSGVVAAVEQGGGIVSPGYSVVVPPLNSDNPALANRAAVPDAAALGGWGVTHVVAAYPLDAPNLEQVDVIDGVYVYANRDPSLTTDFPTTPAWAEGASDLPDAPTVADLNQLTLTAAAISGVVFVGVLALGLLSLLGVLTPPGVTKVKS